MNHAVAIEKLLRSGPKSCAEICARLSISPSTVSRTVSQMPAVIPMGRARAARYGLLEGLMGMPPRPHGVYRVTHEGAVLEIGRISAIAGANFWYENLEAPERSRPFDSLPWFLQDMRPQGFLGRATVREFALRGWPPTLDRWTERHVLAALVQSSGHDHIGHFLIGDRSVEAFHRAQGDLLSLALPADEALRLQRYEDAVGRLGDQALSGSSINGEQPKFTARVQRPGTPHSQSVIVKFAPPLSTDAGRRWADLLVMEELALQAISNELGITSANARCLVSGDRAFLEVDRFDRLPEGGRLGVISMTSLDAEYVGLGVGWQPVARRLAEAGLIEADAPGTLAALDMFGDLIGNTDRHLGNASFFFDGQRPMTLTPVYDFLPMRYAPRASETYSEPLHFQHDVLDRHGLPLEMGDRILATADRFWQTASRDERISAAMREICRHNSPSIRMMNRPLSSMGAPRPGSPENQGPVL